jgi:CheY-like chemotaxis protein
MDGIAAVGRLKAAWPEIPVVMLTVFEELVPARRSG